MHLFLGLACFGLVISVVVHALPCNGMKHAPLEIVRRALWNKDRRTTFSKTRTIRPRYVVLAFELFVARDILLCLYEWSRSPVGIDRYMEPRLVVDHSVYAW
jgi:hypothetical protein